MKSYLLDSSQTEVALLARTCKTRGLPWRLRSFLLCPLNFANYKNFQQVAAVGMARRVRVSREQDIMIEQLFS